MQYQSFVPQFNKTLHTKKRMRKPLNSVLKTHNTQHKSPLMFTRKRVVVVRTCNKMFIFPLRDSHNNKYVCVCWWKNKSNNNNNNMNQSTSNKINVAYTHVLQINFIHLTHGEKKSV